MVTTPNTQIDVQEETEGSLVSADSERHIARAGTFTGLFALIGSSCCFLPVLLVNLGVSVGLVERLGFFARHRTTMLGISVVLLIIAASLVFRKGRPRTSVLIWLGVGVVMIAVAYIIPNYERELLAWVNKR